ncbi:MAG: hypothetical protein GXO37_07640 [Chloroflexi bacterium]|nr:hypothetical protein [Chloroflexota bacterium]
MARTLSRGRARWGWLALLVLVVAAGAGLWWFRTQRQGPDAATRAVLERMLDGWTRWNSVAGEAVVLFIDEDGQQQGFRERFIVQKPFLARFEVLDLDAQAIQGVWMTDGVTTYFFRPGQGYQEGDLPQHLDEKEARLPQTWAELPRDEEVQHPFQAEIPSPIAQFLFPLPFVRKAPGVEYRLEEESTLLDRPVWVLTIEDPQNQVEERLWVDQETGVVLRYVQLVRGQPRVRFDMLMFVVDEPWDKMWFAPKEGQSVE